MLIYRFIEAQKPSSYVICSFTKLTWLEPAIQSKTSTWSAVNFKEAAQLIELLTWASDMVMWYWSADTLF